MRNEEEILNEIKTWALARDDIRGVILTGSRANPNAPTDLLSDYDIELLVNKLEKFSLNDQWVSVFGEILHSYREDQADFSMRLILFRDYVRIDFKIYEFSYIEKQKDQKQLPEHWDAGYKALVDKDGAWSDFLSPSFTSFLITKPSENDFLSVIHEFWWDVTYVAKSLLRNEIYYAKYMLDYVIRFSYQQKVIEWYIGLGSNWRIGTNKHGRFFRKHLNEEIWGKLQMTFAGSSKEDNWSALFATTALFGQLTKALAEGLNYFYPQKTANEISDYLEKIRNLDRQGNDII